MPHVPARYLGHPVVLKEGQGRLYDGDGNALSSHLMVAGQTLLIPDTELYGMTYKRTTRQTDDRTLLGAGRIILPEDVGKSAEELMMAGYEFHEGRPDFEPYVPTAESKSTLLQAHRRVRGTPVQDDTLPNEAVFTPEESSSPGKSEENI